MKPIEHIYIVSWIFGIAVCIKEDNYINAIFSFILPPISWINTALYIIKDN